MVRRASFAATDLAKPPGQDPRAVAEGFLRIAVANMANAIKQVSLQKGHDAARFALQCFGGAGGQHACLVADELGMDTVFIHPFAGVLSAYGMGLADQAVLREQAVEVAADRPCCRRCDAQADRLAAGRRAALLAQGADPAALRSPPERLHLRYQGTQAALEVPLAPMDGASPPSPPRTAPASASPRRSARWWSRRWRWRRRRRARRVAEATELPATRNRRRAGRRSTP